MRTQKIKPFLGPDVDHPSFDDAAFVILPVPYEGGVSFGTGTAQAPQAVLEASAYLELYDEVLDCEPYRAGIVTLESPDIPEDDEAMFSTVHTITSSLLGKDKFAVLLGGDHSLTCGFYKALRDKYGPVSVIQLDAHADLRDSYEGSKLSHACTMSRIREYTQDTLQIGIRSMSVEEAERVKAENINLCTMHDFRSGNFNLDAALATLPDPVFITCDVDVFDWSVIASTGTPEPGGLLWDEAMALLQNIFTLKNVVGFDVVELAYRENDRNSPFAVAKLIYKMIGFK
jgi:agmatinase